MKFKQEQRIETIIDIIQPQQCIQGLNAPHQAQGISEIHHVEEGDIVFVDSEKYYAKTLASKASFILIDKELEAPKGKVLLCVNRPFQSYQKLVRHYFPSSTYTHSGVSPKASIGAKTCIAPTAFVGDGASIGEDCIIFPHAVILDNVKIGNRVIIHSGAIIGGNSFYFNKQSDETGKKYTFMQPCGEVCIEDDVEIGSNTTVDRGVTGATRVGKGTKIDNLVQIAHEVRIGCDCIIASQTGIAGNTILEDGVKVMGQVGIADNARIGKNVSILACSAVKGDILEGSTYIGYPATNSVQFVREQVWISRIGELWKDVQELKKDRERSS